MYVCNVRVHAFNGYLYTNKRTVQYTRAPHVRAHIHLDRQTKGSDVRRNGREGGVGGGGGGRKEAEEGGTGDGDRKTHIAGAACGARSDWDPLGCNERFFFSSLNSFLAGPWCMVATC